jgi:hypothetical protein
VSLPFAGAFRRRALSLSIIVARGVSRPGQGTLGGREEDRLERDVLCRRSQSRAGSATGRTRLIAHGRQDETSAMACESQTAPGTQLFSASFRHGRRLIRAHLRHVLRHPCRCPHAASSGDSRPGSPRRSLGASRRRCPLARRSLRHTSRRCTWPQGWRLAFCDGDVGVSWAWHPKVYSRRAHAIADVLGAVVMPPEEVPSTSVCVLDIRAVACARHLSGSSEPLPPPWARDTRGRGA